MRIVALIFIVFAVTANFFYEHPLVFVAAAFSYFLLVWLLITKKKNKPTTNTLKPTKEHHKNKQQLDAGSTHLENAGHGR